MCWICDLYGDPEIEDGRWFLNPENHSRHMYKIKRPDQKAQAYGTDPEAESGKLVADIMAKRLEDPEEFKRQVTEANAMKGDGPFQIGQVVPIQEAVKIAELSYPVASMHCICRYHCRGHQECNKDEYSCTGLGVGMLKWERWPERYKGGVHFMDPEEVKAWLTKWNKKGMVHTIMTFGGSFVGGLCNCDYPDCNIIRNRLDYGIETGCLKSHYVAKVDYDECNGCGVCVQRCQFGAIKFEVTQGKTNIDHMRCFGCGLCETGCPSKAIELKNRESMPGLREMW